MFIPADAEDAMVMTEDAAETAVTDIAVTDMKESAVADAINPGLCA